MRHSEATSLDSDHCENRVKSIQRGDKIKTYLDSHLWNASQEQKFLNVNKLVIVTTRDLRVGERFIHSAPVTESLLRRCKPCGPTLCVKHVAGS
jgi:hypothetical protein